jgi:hypothetical protein
MLGSSLINCVFYLAYPNIALRFAPQILKIIDMKNSSRKIKNDDQLIISRNDNFQMPVLDIDKEIGQWKEMSQLDQNDRWKEITKNKMENLTMEREHIIKSSSLIINAAIKRTAKRIRRLPLSDLKSEVCYLMKTKRCPFSKTAIEGIGKSIKSISCQCTDGIVRVFNIKIEAGYVRESPNGREYPFVMVLFSTRNPSKSKIFTMEFSKN